MLTVDTARKLLAEDGYTNQYIEGFLEAYKSSPGVWRAFERIALDLIARGKKAGAIDILGKIRWETKVEGGLDWKVNNNYAPYYARIFVHKYPEHAGFFEFRRVGA